MKSLSKVQASDFLNEDEIRLMRALWSAHQGNGFAKRFIDEIVTPVHTRINESLGITCDPWDLAYAVEYRLLFKRAVNPKPRRKVVRWQG